LKKPLIVFFLYVSKKVKRLGIPKVGDRSFLISLEKRVTPLETFIPILDLISSPNQTYWRLVIYQHNTMGKKFGRFKKLKKSKIHKLQKNSLKVNIQIKLSSSKLKTQSIKIYCKILCILGKKEVIWTLYFF
jgi:hypothetical protein